MTRLVLRSGLTFCLIEGRAVFLDLERDRYFGLGATATARLLRCLASNEPDPQDSRCFLDSDVLVAGPTIGSGCIADPPHVAADSVNIDLVTPRLRLITISVVLLLISRLKQIIRPKRLLRDGLRLKWLERWRRMRPAEDIAVILASMQFAQKLAPVAVNCVSQSQALKTLLDLRAVDCSLIIGVRLHPFGAHCWLQRGDVLLNDSPDHVTMFTPIKVL